MSTGAECQCRAGVWCRTGAWTVRHYQDYQRPRPGGWHAASKDTRPNPPGGWTVYERGTVRATVVSDDGLDARTDLTPRRREELRKHRDTIVRKLTRSAGTRRNR